MVDFFEEESY
jgi:hypothetical protein